MIGEFCQAMHEKTYRFEIARSAAGGIATGTHSFEVALEDRMTMLDALFRIRREKDSSLAFRCACRVGMCGTCAMSINGVPRLACRTRVANLEAGPVAVSPLANLPVVKDLVVSLEPFFEQWKRILPAFRPLRPDSQTLAVVPASSRYARETQRKRDCITCGACYAACGIKRVNGEFLGPAAINRAFLRVLDPRDGAARERLRVLDGERSGVWRCHTQFNCTTVCPKNIDLTDAIGWMKRGLLWPAALERKPEPAQ